jgi:quercetin dioxygenase-like cupin family protein
MRVLTGVVVLLLSAAAAQAQESKANGPHAVIAFPNEIKFGPAPAVLPAGAKLAVIEGDPSKAGEFTMRLWMPAGYRIPPHFHPATEHVTVVSGTFFVGMGDQFDKSKGTRLPAGTFGALPIGMHHFAWTEGETVIQLHGTGPWSLTYVNKSDDPSRKGN